VRQEVESRSTDEQEGQLRDELARGSIVDRLYIISFIQPERPSKSAYLADIMIGWRTFRAKVRCYASRARVGWLG
jgi:hypothetical protein